jgi:hypothetical protein
LADVRAFDVAVTEAGVSPVVDGSPVDRPATEAGQVAEAGRTSEAGTTEAGMAVVTDPAPTVTTPGQATLPATCSGCPTTTDTTFTIDAGTATSYLLEGWVSIMTSSGVFYVESAPDAAGNVQRISGSFPIVSDGLYAVTIPLFCGTQLVKLVFTNSAGSTVVVKRITTTGCIATDIRATISWDVNGLDWELHLIKPGGRLNDQTNGTDCTGTTCVRSRPDWGVRGDQSDDPFKDVDNNGNYGPENIYLSRPETGRFTVVVEHRGNGTPSTGQAIINVRGTAYVFKITGFLSQWVWTVATIDWPSGAVTAVDTRFDCSANWSRGCLAAVP